MIYLLYNTKIITSSRYMLEILSVNLCFEMEEDK